MMGIKNFLFLIGKISLNLVSCFQKFVGSEKFLKKQLVYFIIERENLYFWQFTLTTAFSVIHLSYLNARLTE